MSGRHIPDHHRAGGDHRVVADGDAAENDRAGADLDAVANHRVAIPHLADGDVLANDAVLADPRLAADDDAHRMPELRGFRQLVDLHVTGGDQAQIPASRRHHRQVAGKIAKALDAVQQRPDDFFIHGHSYTRTYSAPHWLAIGNTGSRLKSRRYNLRALRSTARSRSLLVRTTVLSGRPK